MTIQINGDELERKKFEDWFNSEWREIVEMHPRMETIRYKNIAKAAWMERSKQEIKND